MKIFILEAWNYWVFKLLAAYFWGYVNLKKSTLSPLQIFKFLILKRRMSKGKEWGKIFKLLLFSTTTMKALYIH